MRNNKFIALTALAAAVFAGQSVANASIHQRDAVSYAFENYKKSKVFNVSNGSYRGGYCLPQKPKNQQQRREKWRQVPQRKRYGK